MLNRSERKRFAGSKRAMKTSGWLLCSRAKAESASIKFANTYRKRSSIRRINGPAHLSMGRISAPKCIPSRFMIPHTICLRWWCTVSLEQSVCSLFLRNWKQRCRILSGAWRLFGALLAGITATNWARISCDVLDKLSPRIVNEV